MNSISLEEVLACPTLPSLPKVAMEVLELTRRPEVDLKEIAKVVQNDQALSAKILKTINSSYYALDKPCTTISRAMVYLGVNTIKSLVLGFSLVDITDNDDDGFDLKSYWRRCVYSSAAARRIAALAPRCDPEEAFTASLLQDVGMLALDAATDHAYSGLLAELEGFHTELPEVEQEILGFTHATVSADLAERWQLPARITKPIRHHHETSEAALAEQSDLIFITAVGHLLAVSLAESECQEDIESVGDALRQRYELDDEAIAGLVEGTLEDANALSSLLQVNVGRRANLAAIMADAEDQRLAHSLTMQRQVDALQESNSALTAQAHTDSLTGVANRHRFDAELAERFTQARAESVSFGIVIVDADHFKSVNDTHGHPAGDAVLVGLARRLSRAVQGAGLVSRYGGEEFVVIAPGADLEQTTRLAEAVRQVVAATPFDVGGTGASVDQLAVTISVGVAAFEPDAAAIFTRPEVVVSAADRALYAAKNAGRNCVRVFNPRPRAQAS